jgi:hypothetical protein
MTSPISTLQTSEDIIRNRRVRSPLKEVIQPHLPVRLPCYDFTPVISPALGVPLLTVRVTTSGVTNSHGVTGGVYKARERIHRSMLTCDY